MYGFLIGCLKTYVIDRSNERKWLNIRDKCLSGEETHLDDYQIYDDEILLQIIAAISISFGLPENDVLAEAGCVFFDRLYSSCYTVVLQNLGCNLEQFLEGLDSIHEHMTSRFPGMRAPSFHVLPCAESTQFYLCYWSERVGLSGLVIGIVKRAAEILFHIEVKTTKVISTDRAEDKIMFLVEILSGDIEAFKTADYDNNENEAYMLDQSDTSTIDPDLLCNAFPFHMMLNKDLIILQVGVSLLRMMPNITLGHSKFDELFTVKTPDIRLSYKNIKERPNAVFSVLALSETNEDSKQQGSPNGSQEDTDSIASGETESIGLKLKGQMFHLKETSSLLFLCSPRVLSLDGLNERGMYLSDIPIHDATRDLILLSEQHSAENSLTKRFEHITEKLQKTSRELEKEKKLADKLLYSILPQSVANDLRAKRPVAAKKYELVTVMFSGIVDFSSFCNDCQEPMEIVQLLNEVYTEFDAKTESNPDIYKVETVGDKYMAVSGLPVPHERHAHTIASLALEIVDITTKITIQDRQLRVTIGIHSGEVVTGVVGKKLPRYCLFGNTVNLTSRCETTGVQGKINVTEESYRCLMVDKDPRWKFEVRGPIQMKGRAQPMTCYLLSSW